MLIFARQTNYTHATFNSEQLSSANYDVFSWRFCVGRKSSTFKPIIGRDVYFLKAESSSRHSRAQYKFLFIRKLGIPDSPRKIYRSHGFFVFILILVRSIVTKDFNYQKTLFQDCGGSVTQPPMLPLVMHCNGITVLECALGTFFYFVLWPCWP